MWKCRKFFHLFVRFQCNLKKKNGHRADGGIFFSDFMLISKKKKVLRLSSASFLCALCDIQKRGAINRSCLRFLAGNKNASIWREKKRWNSQNFSAECRKKFCTFCACREHCSMVDFYVVSVDGVNWRGVKWLWTVGTVLCKELMLFVF